MNTPVLEEFQDKFRWLNPKSAPNCQTIRNDSLAPSREYSTLTISLALLAGGMTASSTALSASQTRTAWSLEPVTICTPFGEYAMHVKRYLSPCNAFNFTPLCASQTRSDLSSEMLAILNRPVSTLRQRCHGHDRAAQPSLARYLRPRPALFYLMTNWRCVYCPARKSRR